MTTRQLVDEARGYKKFLAEESVAERWQEILEPLRQAQLERMVAEHSGNQ